MSDLAIHVENLSKRYRIGLKEEMHDTLFGAMADFVRQPIKNLRRLRQLSRFEEDGRDSEDIIWALKDVSFEVEQGEVVGIIGRNGAGKTTLLKILSHITEPTSGRAEIHGRVSSLLEVGTGFHPELTGRENIYLNGTILGMKRAEIDRKYDEIVDFSGVEKFIDTPVKRYSSGMQVRLAFAVAAHLDPEILMIDEVLAVGDFAFQKKCLGKMGAVTQEGRTVLFVSHNMAAIRSLCERCILLRQGKIARMGATDDVVGYYVSTIDEGLSSDNVEPGLWVTRDGEKSNGAIIERVEMLDPASGRRKSDLRSRDPVAFRMYYRSQADFPGANFRFGVRSEENIKFLNYYTKLDDGVDTPISKGNGYIDCVFPSFPLVSRRFIIMVGIAARIGDVVYTTDDYGVLEVLPELVQGASRALDSRYCAVSAEHEWRMGE